MDDNFQKLLRDKCFETIAAFPGWPMSRIFVCVDFGFKEKPIGLKVQNPAPEDEGLIGNVAVGDLLKWLDDGAPCEDTGYVYAPFTSRDPVPEMIARALKGFW